MRISYYCQHVLGIGHLRRSLEICKTLAQHHETTLILGGPAVSLNSGDLNIVQLPGLQMDQEFNNLSPCDTSRTLGVTKERRKKTLYDHFTSFAPDCFITELYPFGRKAFGFELEPILRNIKNKVLPSCTCVCSVRDILVEKQQGKEKFEENVVGILNNYYRGVLVHADPEIVTLDETFTPLGEIQIPLYYTGYVSEKPSLTDTNQIRQRKGLGKKKKLIVASAGGGAVGHDLLFAVLAAFTKLLTSEPDVHLQVFTGPSCDQKIYDTIKDCSGPSISVDRFTDSFPDWLAAADLSISMAGYNTCMNLLQTGVPALVLPFMQNREQLLRAEKLGEKAPISLITKDDLRVDILSAKMAQHLKLQRRKTTIALQGAEESLKFINTLMLDKKI